MLRSTMFAFLLALCGASIGCVDQDDSEQPRVGDEENPEPEEEEPTDEPKGCAPSLRDSEDCPIPAP